MPDPGTDRDELRRSDVYGTVTPLRDRASLYDHLERPQDVVDWVLGFLDGVDPTGVVLDVGCGDGKYAARLASRGRTVAAVDLSPGMAATARDALRASVVGVGDVQALPVGDGAVAAVLAPHMLYHPPDIPQAVRELARVVARGGVVVALTNGTDHLDRLWTTLMAARSECDGRPPERYRPGTDRFNLDNGAAFLATCFDVERHDLHNRLSVPDPGPLLRYVETVRPFFEARAFTDASWSSILAAFERRVAAVIEAEGTWTDVTHAGVFVCRSTRV